MINNNYPLQIIENELKKHGKYKQLNIEKVASPDEKKFKFLSIPFINDKSEIIGRKIHQSINEYLVIISYVKLRLAFKSQATLDPSKLSMVVYHLKCKNCPAHYIGQSNL